MNTIIIGGGWAGLAAAVELSKNKISVTVLEAARQLGGRARSIKFNDNRVDSGQHILLGAYTGILNILETIGVPEEKVFRRLPIYMEMKKSAKKSFRLNTPALPAPLHLIWGLLGFKGMKLSHRFRILQALIKMQKNQFTVSPDTPLSIFLKKTGQPMEAIACFWEPLCISILNLPVDQASTQLFMSVMGDAFFDKKEYSDLLLPISDLGACLPQPAMEFIEQQGGHVQLGTRVKQLLVSKGASRGIIADEKQLDADHVIVATSPEACEQLLSENNLLNDTVNNIHELGSMPITTLYLQYPGSVSLPREFVGLIGTTTQWLFDRKALTGQKGLIAAVVSGPGDHMKMDTDHLTQHIIKEISDYFPSWPKPVQTKLIREKRATIAAVPDSNNFRPNNLTGIQGLWLAGDYTATGYPSTLEGAVRSGVECARQILKQQ
ncbi:MAG: hydroxysqualene dehydroxylase HpnE [Gammaproteobacteria bacterium]|nr:MAG: hydroxysqualene dehydroxylase HpnE [Gammaproteobacteria bacterium]